MKVESEDHMSCRVLIFAANIASLVVQSRFRIKFGLGQQSPDEYANTKGWIVSMFTAGMTLGCLLVSYQLRR